MESNSVCNHTSDKQGGSPVCFITSMITTELDDMKFCYQSIITLTKFVKKAIF